MAWDKGYPKYEKCFICNGKGFRYVRDFISGIGSFKLCSYCQGCKVVQSLEEDDDQIDSIYERNHNK